MARLKREVARQGRTMTEPVESALRPMFRSPRERGDSPRSRHFGAAVTSSTSRTATRFTGSWGALVFVIDTDIPVYAADADSPLHQSCHAQLQVWHARTTVLMREHGSRRFHTRDTDFHRFPCLEPQGLTA